MEEKKTKNFSKYPTLNREYKDSLFRLIFSEKKDLLDLYNALNGTSYSDPEELEVNTLEDAVYISIKNDICHSTALPLVLTVLTNFQPSL
jgi:hypothetical protein